MLGGNTQRFLKVLQLIKKHKECDVLLSIAPREIPKIIKYLERDKDTVDLSMTNFYIDLKAIDTIDNFIETKTTIKRLSVDKVLLVTSDYHMKRAIAVGKIILDKVELLPRSFKDKSQKKETRWQRLKDIAAASFYRIFGFRINDSTLKARKQKRDNDLIQFPKNMSNGLLHDYLLYIPNARIIQR